MCIKVRKPLNQLYITIRTIQYTMIIMRLQKPMVTLFQRIIERLKGYQELMYIITFISTLRPMHKKSENSRSRFFQYITLGKLTFIIH